MVPRLETDGNHYIRANLLEESKGLFAVLHDLHWTDWEIKCRVAQLRRAVVTCHLFLISPSSSM
jgi:hypothetical protein